MPRRRIISCDHCGFMQLKRDEYCEQCGSITAREKKKIMVSFVYYTVIAIVGVGFYLYLQDVSKNLFH